MCRSVNEWYVVFVCKALLFVPSRCIFVWLTTCAILRLYSGRSLSWWNWNNWIWAAMNWKFWYVNNFMLVNYIIYSRWFILVSNLFYVCTSSAAHTERHVSQISLSHFQHNNYDLNHVYLNKHIRAGLLDLRPCLHRTPGWALLLVWERPLVSIGQGKQYLMTWQGRRLSKQLTSWWNLACLHVCHKPLVHWHSL